MTASYGFLELELDGRSAFELAAVLVVVGRHWPRARCHHTAVGILTVELGAVFADEPVPSAVVSSEGAAPAQNGTRAGQAAGGAAKHKRERRHHSDADKAAAVALARSVGVAETSRRLDVAQSVLRHWLALCPAPVAEPEPEPVDKPELAPVSDLARRIRDDTAAIAARTAAFVDSGPRHPVDHDAVKAAAYQEDGF